MQRDRLSECHDWQFVIVLLFRRGSDAWPILVASCSESRRPCSMATGSRPRAWDRLAERLPRASRQARASGPDRACSRTRCKGKARSSATLLSHSRSRSIASEMLQTSISPSSLMRLKWASLVIKIAPVCRQVAA